MDSGDRRIRAAAPRAPRRRFLARVGAWAGAVAGGAGGILLQSGARAAAPGTAAPVITLRLAVDWEGLSAAANQAPLFIGEVLRHFEAAHPGLRVQVTLGPCSNGPNNTCADCNMANALTGLIAGDGPDVFSVCGSTSGLVEGGFVQPLTPYLRRDNIPEDTWPSQTLVRHRYGGDLYFLPSEEQPAVLACNRGLLSQLGIDVPGPDWTHTEAATIWRAAAGPIKGGRRYGVTADGLTPGSNGGWAWIFGGFGGQTHDPSGTRSTFATPQGIAAGLWLQSLQRENVATGGDLYGNPVPFQQGQTAFVDAPSWAVPVAAVALRGMDWVFQPYPVFPDGRSTWLGGNPYALSAATSHAEAAWALLRWLCVEPDYWRYEVKVTLNTPAQTALWPEWEAAVLAVAPDLQGKGLHWYADAMIHNYARWGSPFAYNEPQVNNVIGTWSSQIWAGRVSVAEAFAQIDRQVDALESVAAGAGGVAPRTPAVAARQLAYVQADPQARRFGPPSRGGAGLGVAPAGNLVRVRGSRVAVEGAGQGLTGSADDGTFACSATTAGLATFVCRLTALGTAAAGALNPAATAGLMVRSALGDSAPMLAVVVSQGQGVTVDYRQAPLFGMNSNGPASGSERSGLIAPAFVMYAPKPARANYLRQPLWLKVVRDVRTWTVYTSLDGTTWTAAGPALALEIAGAWVGLFVASPPAGPGTAPRVRAEFDHLSGFWPDTFVALGAGR